MRIRPTRNMRHQEEEEEEEAVFISVVNTNEDPPNAHQAEAVFIRGVNTNEDSPNAQHALHRPVQDTGRRRWYS